jgi:hypothetical protein
VNHSILTGELSAESREGRSPTGDPVTLLRIEFPVADLAHPRRPWRWTSFGVEVPGDLPRQRGVKDLQGGAPILVAGQLSERWVIEQGRSYRRGFIVASLLHPRPLPDQPGELFVTGGRP